MNTDPNWMACFGVGVLALLGSLTWVAKIRAFAARALTATGQVVRIQAMATSRGGSVFCPVVQFRSSTGETVEFTSDYGTRPASHQVGQAINVLYDPADPWKAQLEGTRYFAPAVVIVIGLGFSTLGALGMGLPGAIGEALWPGSGAAGRFHGAWAAENEQTNSITRVEISGRWPGIQIRMWGKCSPVDCDWGRPASYMPDRIPSGELTVTWRPSFAEKRQTLRLLADGRLEVVTHTHFTDRSGRRDYESRDFFQRTNAR